MLQWYCYMFWWSFINQFRFTIVRGTGQVGSQRLKKLYCQKQGVGSFLAVHLQVNSIVFQSTREFRFHAGECMAISLIKLKNTTMNYQILEERVSQWSGYIASKYLENQRQNRELSPVEVEGFQFIPSFGGLTKEVGLSAIPKYISSHVALYLSTQWFLQCLQWLIHYSILPLIKPLFPFPFRRLVEWIHLNVL